MSDIDVDPNIDPSNFIRRQQQASMSYALGSLEDDPEKAARATQLADVTGDNPSLILPNLENYEQQHKAALTAQLLKSNKFLRQYIDADPIHAKISSDGYASLDDISESMKKVYPGPSVVLNSAIDRAIQGYKEGAVQGGGIGDWAFLSPDAREHPLKAAIAGVGWAPIEIAMRFGSGVFRAVTEATYGGVKAGAQQFGADESHADSMAREAAGLIESEMIGARAHEAPRPTLGQHIEALPKEAKPSEFADKTASQIDKALAIFIKAKPWLDEGKVPPKGLDPDIDKALFEQNKLGLDNLDEAYKKVQSDPTHERNEDISAYYLRLHGDSNIGISGDAVARLYGNKVPEVGDNILGWHPGLPEELEMAKATGGDVRFPASELLAKTKPEVWDQLKDDIRVYPHGITKNEVVAEREAKEGLVEPPKPAEIIPELLPSVRGSAGLEPLYSVGDRKLELKSRPHDENLDAGSGVTIEGKQLVPDHYNLHDENDKPVGYVDAIPLEGGKKLFIANVGALEDKGYGPNSFGNHLTRDIARQLKEQYPKAEQIGGYRISGAREKSNKLGQVWIKFDDLERDWSHLVDLRSILSETKVETRGGVLHYSRELSPHEAAADALVRDTLARIAPDAKVFTPSAISIPERPDVTRRGFMQPHLEQNPWIVVALDADKPEGIARHEGVHFLRQFGFFSDDEWFNLVRAAKENDWARKFGIAERYKDLPESAKLEEAIAEGYRNWADGAEVPKYAHPIFEKIKALLTQLREGMAKLLGRDVSWQEVFEKIESGEVGTREPTGHTDGAFLEPSASDEPAFGKGAVTTVERQKLYDDLIQKRHAEDLAAAMKRSEAEHRKTQTKEWKENEKAVRTEVDESIRNRPDVAADLFFGAGELYGTKVSKKVKLGSAFLTDEQKARLPKDYIAKDGMNPDDLAGLFGYQSGDTLVNHLGDYNAAKIAAGMSAKDFVTRATDIETARQMELRYGQLEQSILEHATEQAQSETQLNLLHEETYRLATEAGLQYTITKEQLRSSVQDQFDGMQVKSLDPERFRASMEKANKAIELALLKEKPTEAYQAAQQKELAFIMWKEASALEKAKDKLDKTAKVFRKPLVPTVDAEYLNHIHNLLQRAGYQIGRTPEHIAENIASKASTNIAEFTNEKLKESAGYRDIPVADALNDPNFAKPVQDMTAFEFYGFKQTIDALVKQGRDEQKFIRQGEAHDLKEVIGQMVDQIKTFPLKTYKATKGGWAKATDLPRSFMAGTTNMETIFNRFDRDDPRGIFNRYIVYSLFKMSNGENAMLREFSKPYRELGFDKADMGKLVDAPFADPLNRDAGPWNGFTRGNVLAILQNAGNKSNLRVMAKGYGMEPEALMTWLEANTTKEDWVRAQKLGGIFKDLIKHADGVYERINGITVQKIPLEPISNIHGEFDGWYHPLIKDPIRRGNIPERIGVYDDSDFGHTTTANGYTKKRTGAIYPLDITFDSVTNRMTQMIHDINFREGVLELQKVFKNPKFLDSITAHYGEHYSDLMKPYLESIAGSASVPSKAMAKATQWSEYIRQNVISTYIGFNPSTALKHGPTAWAFSARQVGLIPFLNAFYKTAAEAIGFKDAVKGLYGQSSELGIRNSEFAMKWSEELQRRERHWQDTFAGANKLLEGASTVREQMIQYASWLVAKSDMLSAKPTWIAAYEKATQEGSNHGEAIDIADSKVRKAHGSTAQVNQPALVRGGGPLHSWLTSIYGFFGTDMQRKIETAHAINDMYQLGKEGEIKSAAKMAPGIVADIMTYAIWTVIVEEVVSSQYTDDKRSGLTRLAGFGSTALSNSVLYLRDLAYAFNTGHDPGVGLVSSPLHDMSNVVRDIKRGSGSFSKQRAGKTLENILTLTGDGTGMAPRTIDHALRFGVDLVNRQVHPKTAGDWWRGVTHGTTEKRIER